MATITTRSGKGSPLTNTEVDSNFTNLNTDKVELSDLSVTDSGGDGSLSYNNSTGVFTYTGPSASEVRAHISGGTGVTVSSGEIAIGQAVATNSNVTFNNVTVSATFTLGSTAITATGAEINVLDGITASTAELNYTDGVTSNIQTQLDGKFNADTNLQAFVTAFTLPTSDGSSGQALTTNGSGTLAFSDVDALPSQSGNSGYYLTTDGSSASWSNLTNDPTFTGTVTINSNEALTLPAGTTAQRPTAATGMVRYNSTTGKVEFYDGSAWSNINVDNAYTRTNVTATSGQTTFSATYSVGYIDVYLNGVKLIAGTDFTASNGSSVVLASGAATGDLFEAIAWNAANVAQNAYTKTSFTATANQTTFSVTYTAGFVNVYLNGVLLLDGTEYTATNGTSIVLAAGAAVNDSVVVEAFSTFSASSALTVTNNLSDLNSAATALTNLGLTATAAELNILDGVTSTAAELNILDGVTSTTAELNILDGVTATAAELNLLDGVTATTAEINYLDITTLGLTEASKAVTADANGVVSFDNGTIEEVTSVTSSSNAATINLRDGNLFEHDLTENVTYTFSNPAAAGRASSFVLKVIQDSTARTITWPASVDWAAATAPTLTATNNGVDVFVFFTIDGGTTYYGFTAGQAMG